MTLAQAADACLKTSDKIRSSADKFGDGKDLGTRIIFAMIPGLEENLHDVKSQADQWAPFDSTIQKCIDQLVQLARQFPTNRESSLESIKSTLDSLVTQCQSAFNNAKKLQSQLAEYEKEVETTNGKIAETLKRAGVDAKAMDKQIREAKKLAEQQKSLDEICKSLSYGASLNIGSSAEFAAAISEAIQQIILSVIAQGTFLLTLTKSMVSSLSDFIVQISLAEENLKLISTQGIQTSKTTDEFMKKSEFAALLSSLQDVAKLAA